MSDPPTSRTRLRWFGLAFALLLVGAGAFVGVSPGEPSGDEIADRVGAKYDAAESYAGTVETSYVYENGTNRTSRSATVEVQYVAPDNHRVDLPARNATAATNGTVAWYYNRTNGTLVVRQLNESHREVLRTNVSALVDRLQDNATVTRNGTSEVNGEETYVLDVDPENESWATSATVWVDTDDWRVLKAQTVVDTENRTLRTTTRVDSFRFNVSIHESAFAPPNGTAALTVQPLDVARYDSLEAAQDNTSFELVAPTASTVESLGLDRTGIAVWTRGNETTATLRYENGSQRAVVVESEASLDRYDGSGEPVDVAGYNATVLEKGDYHVVTWEADSIRYAVAGDLPRADVLSLAESVAERIE